MMKQVLSEVFEQRIVVFEFSGDEFVASAQLSLFVSDDVTDIPSYLYTLHEVDPITGEIGPYDPTILDEENYLTTQAPKNLNMPLVTIPNTLVCHYLFGPQRAQGEMYDILKEYERISNI